MKNKKTVLWLVLIAITAVSAYSQQYDSERDFEVERDENVRGGVVIIGYVGNKREVRIPPRIQNSPVTGIGGGTFGNNGSLTSVTIPSSVTSIDVYAFTWSSSLTAINVDAANTAYSSQDGVLYNKNKTTLIAYPAGKTGAFTIPNGVTSIGQQAFDGCTSLTGVTIPNSVTSIGDSAFNGCTGLTAINVTVANTAYSSQDGALYNKAKTSLIQCPGGKTGAFAIPNGVTSIESSAFSGCSSLTSIDIPNGVTSIGYNAFMGCTGLASVTIPNSVTSIGQGTFGYCTKLTSVTIPNSVTSIGYNAFSGCTSLASVTIPNGVTSIGNSAFRECTSLTSVTIPNSVTSIEAFAFNGCSKLARVTIGNGVTSIEEGAFSETAWLNNQPNGLVYAGKVAYIYKGTMPANTSITILDGTKEIAGSVFRNCTGLISITIPSSVTSIGNSAFAGCKSLASVTIPSSVTSIGDTAFHSCTGLTSVTIPNSVKSIGDAAFYECKSLTSVIIGNGVTSIGINAFYGCPISPAIRSEIERRFGRSVFSGRFD